MLDGHSADKMKSKMSKNALTRMVFTGVLIIVLAVCITIFFAQEQEAKRLKRKHEELQTIIAELEAEKYELEQLYNIAGTPEYVERIARDSLGMVAPEDLIIQEQN